MLLVTFEITCCFQLPDGEVTGLTCLECDGAPGSDCYNGVKGTDVHTITQSPLNAKEACLVCVKAYGPSGKLKYSDQFSPAM